MRPVLRLLPLVLLGVIGVILFGGRALPKNHQVERSIVVERSPTEVFREVATAAGWMAWYTGPDVGARVEGPTRLVVEHEGTVATLELTKTSSPTQVTFRHSTDAVAGPPVEGELNIAANGPNRSVVTLSETVSVDGSTQRWMVFLAGDWLMGQVLERELHNLKSLVETGKTHVASGGGT